MVVIVEIVIFSYGKQQLTGQINILHCIADAVQSFHFHGSCGIVMMAIQSTGTPTH